MRRLILALLLASALPLAAQAPATLPRFAIKDQFNRQLTHDSLAGTPVLILVANRQGTDAMFRWFQALSAAAVAAATPGGLRILMTADTKGAPFFVKGAIKGRMPKDSLQPVLLDYSGALARAIRGSRDTLVAALYGPDGTLHRRERLSPDTEDPSIISELLTPP